MRQSERQVQRHVLRVCGHLFPSVMLVHVPNGAHLAGTAGALLGDGMRKGFPDLVALWSGGVGFLEVKNSDGGKVSPEQLAMHQVLRDMNHRICVVTSASEAIDALAAWGAPMVGRNTA